MPDHSGWFRSDPSEGFRLLSGPSAATPLRRPGFVPGPGVRAGYRWGSAAARAGCEVVEATGGPLDTSWAHPAPATSLVPVSSERHLPVPRFDRAMLAVAARTEWLAGAVERIESRLDEMSEQFVDVATHGDLVELESRRARLAAEVSRLSVELKGELDRRLGELARAVATGTERSIRLNQRGPLELADDRRLEAHVDRATAAEVHRATA